MCTPPQAICTCSGAHGRSACERVVPVMWQVPSQAASSLPRRHRVRGKLGLLWRGGRRSQTWPRHGGVIMIMHVLMIMCPARQIGGRSAAADWRQIGGRSSVTLRSRKEEPEYQHVVGAAVLSPEVDSTSLACRLAVPLTTCIHAWRGASVHGTAVGAGGSSGGSGGSRRQQWRQRWGQEAAVEAGGGSGGRRRQWRQELGSSGD